jgi:hypothetical protein
MDVMKTLLPRLQLIICNYDSGNCNQWARRLRINPNSCEFETVPVGGLDYTTLTLVHPTGALTQDPITCPSQKYVRYFIEVDRLGRNFAKSSGKSDCENLCLL